MVTRLSHSLTYLEYASDRVIRRGRVFGGIRDLQFPYDILVMRLLVLTKALRQGGWEEAYHTISFDADVHGIPGSKFCRKDLGPEDGRKAQHFS
jgi:hypothetical protein